MNPVAVAKAGLGGMYHEENIPGRGVGCVADITIRWSNKHVVTVYVLYVKTIGPLKSEIACTRPKIVLDQLLMDKRWILVDRA